MILDFIKGILAGLTQHPGVQWGNTVMETPYEGWRMWIQDMFANMGWGSIFLIALSALTWTGVYLIIIWRLHKDHAPSMPWVCLCMNFLGVTVLVHGPVSGTCHPLGHLSLGRVRLHHVRS